MTDNRPISIVPRDSVAASSKPDAHDGSIVPLVRALISGLIRAGRTVSPFADETTARRAGGLGVDLKALRGWIPSSVQLSELLSFQARLSTALNPNAWRTLPAIRRQLREISTALAPPQGPVILSLVEKMMDALESKPVSVPRDRSVISLTFPKMSKIPPAEGVRTGSLKNVQPVSGIAPWSDPAKAGNWLHNTPVLTIYIDETWPREDRKIGVLAGIVWRGERPNQDLLPIPPQHLREQDADRFLANATRYLAKLRAQAGNAIPFVFRFEPSNGVPPKKAYEQMVHESLLLLLGWLLPRPTTAGRQVRVRVVCEAMSGEHSDGVDQTERFGGILLQAARRGPQRYQPWIVESLIWRQKLTGSPAHFTELQVREQGYMSYGDLLGYLTLSMESHKAAALVQAVDFASMPAYLNISPELADRLDTLPLRARVEPGWVLDFLIENSRSPLAQAAITHLSEIVGSDRSAGAPLLDELDRRYLAKDRNLGALDQQFSLISRIFGDLGTDAPRRLRLVEMSVRLQRANHFGDPSALLPVEKAYAGLRKQAMDNRDADLVAHIDLSRAVRAADRFEPEQAWLIVEELLEDESRLSLLSRAKAHSSLGQYLSLVRDYERARVEFDAAIELIGRADLDDAERQGEWDQTAIYRAFNAIDGNDDAATTLVDEILTRAGFSGLREGVASLARDANQRHRYRHHLVLRLLDAREDLGELRAAYYSAMGDELGEHHPWEIIALYRGLIASDLGTPAGATGWFERALTIALAPPNGPTLQVIAAMIAAIAWVVTGLTTFRDTGRDILAGRRGGAQNPKRLIDSLPTVAVTTVTLGEILEDASPAADRVDEALSVLSFNYR